jgi:hypothetical protein
MDRLKPHVSSPIIKVLLLPVLYALALVVAGCYGALHNQISYTVAPTYFHGHKFVQFGIPPEYHNRIGAALVADPFHHAGHMHNFSYIGGFLAILTCSAYMIQQGISWQLRLNQGHQGSESGQAAMN